MRLTFPMSRAGGERPPLEPKEDSQALLQSPVLLGAGSRELLQEASPRFLFASEYRARESYAVSNAWGFHLGLSLPSAHSLRFISLTVRHDRDKNVISRVVSKMVIRKSGSNQLHKRLIYDPSRM